MVRNIKGYLIEEQIGKGGFGEVYKAFQPELEREVAIKAILPAHANQPEFIQRFQIEAQLVARLEHPHIVPLYDYWRDPEGAYLVMRWLRGGSLLDVIQGETYWTLDDVAHMLDQVTGALSVAHRNNVIHQDIKPANILLDEDGNAYLTDFGIAQDLAHNINLAKDNPDSDILHGSPAYISPEHLQRKEITAKSDIYSLGLLLYEFLTHHQPFEGAELMQLFNHHLRSRLPRLQTHREDIPEDFNVIIQRATMKDPGARYDDVRQMAEDFRAILAGQSIKDSDPVVSGGRVAQGADTRALNLLRYDAETFNPYKGLRSFEEADSEDFFGRDKLIKELLAKMQDDSPFVRFVAVVGPSGSGKSSVVKAGLIPAIRKSKTISFANSFITMMTPGADPMRQLEGALLRVATRADDHFLRSLNTGDFDLHSMIQSALPADDSELLLVIDQFEELFTLADDLARKTFIQTLVKALTARKSRLRVIVTLRADFYDRPLHFAELGEMVRARTVVVLPLSRDDLEQAIVAPANRAGLLLEPGLTESIVNDVADLSGGLPLLQFALTELYERRDGVNLTVSAYRQIGGISGAIARRAGQIYSGMNPDQRTAVRQIFLRLVKLGEGSEDTRRRAPQREILSLQANKAAIRDALDQFGKYRLLTFDYESVSRAPTVEIAHEALIRSWRDLKNWLDNNRETLRLQSRLTAAVTEWERNNRESSYLASGVRLDQFESILTSDLPISETEQAYLTASIEQRQAIKRRNRLFVSALALVSVVASVAAIAAVLLGLQAESSRQDAVIERDRADLTADIAESRALAAAAINESEFDLSVLLSIEALAIRDTYEARSSLLSRLQSQPRLMAMLPGHSDFVRDVAISPDGELIASAGRDNTVRLWDMATRSAVGQPLTGHTEWVNQVAFLPDRDTLISTSRDATIRLWDVATGQPIGEPLTGHPADVRSLAISAGGDLIATGDSIGTLIVWDVATREPIVTIEEAHSEIIYGLTFDPSGEILASAGGDGLIQLWDVTEPADTMTEPRTLSGHTNWVMDVAFLSDGETLISASADQTLMLWDVQSGERIGAPLRGHNNWVRSVTPIPGQSRVISAGEDGLILIWDLNNGAVLDGFRSVESLPVWDVELQVSTATLITAGTINSVMLWQVSPVPSLASLVEARSGDVSQAAFSADGTQMITTGGTATDPTIHLIDRQSNEQRTLTPHLSSITGLAVAGDGRAVTVSADGVIAMWPVNGEDTQTWSADESLFSVAVSPDLSQIATGTGNAVQVWQVDESGDWVTVATLPHGDRVLSLAYSDDGGRIASGGRDGRLIVWDVVTREPVFEPVEAHMEGVVGLDFAPDSALLASGGRDNLVKLWDTSQPEPVATSLVGHTGWVLSVAFSPNGDMLASSSADETVLLWDVGSRRQLGSAFVAHGDWVYDVDFAPDGRHIISAGRNGTVLTWLIGINSLVERGCALVNRTLTDDEAQRYLVDITSLQPICESETN